MKTKKIVYLMLLVFFSICFLKIIQAQENSQKIISLDIGAQFYATGWMGDGEIGDKHIQLLEACSEDPQTQPYCIKITYQSFGIKAWGGIYWQNRPNNWGDEPGENFSKARYKYVIFWARGAKGGEIVEFKTGGINTPGKKYRDSFEAKIGKVVLNKEWKKFRISLEGKNLSSVIGGFCWVASKAGNPQGLTFYLDDIMFVSDDPGSY